MNIQTPEIPVEVTPEALVTGDKLVDALLVRFPALGEDYSKRALVRHLEILADRLTVAARLNRMED